MGQVISLLSRLKPRLDLDARYAGLSNRELVALTHQQAPDLDPTLLAELQRRGLSLPNPFPSKNPR